MSRGRQVDAWSHTSSLLALLFNVNRGDEAQPVTPEDLHPLLKRAKPINDDRGKAPVDALIAAFCGK